MVSIETKEKINPISCIRFFNAVPKLWQSVTGSFGGKLSEASIFAIFAFFDRERESRTVLQVWKLLLLGLYSYSSSYPWTMKYFICSIKHFIDFMNFLRSESLEKSQKVSENLGKSRKILESLRKFQLTVMHLKSFKSRFPVKICQKIVAIKNNVKVVLECK